MYLIVVSHTNNLTITGGRVAMKCLTPNQVMEILSIERAYVYELFNSKDFPSFKVGTHWRVKEEDLMKWIEKQKKQKISNFN